MNCKMTGYSSAACIILISLLFSGCAGAPDVVYVKEAQQVTTQALDPVMLESAQLDADVSSKFAKLLRGLSVDEIMTAIQTEIANTKRFTKVFLNSSEGDTYIVQPRIERIESVITPIQTDPTRKLLTTRAKVRLDVLFINQKNQKELVKSFYDERTLEERLPAKVSLNDGQKSEFVRRTVMVAFRSAADQLGTGFNPSYEMGSISRLNGKTAYVQINTSKLRKMPKKQQAVEVVDDDNRVLATLAELAIEDGSLSGRVYEKTGASVKEGSTVRARVNALTE